MIKYISLIVYLAFISLPVLSQNNSSSSGLTTDPQFRSIQADGISIIFISKIGASVDFDFFSSKNKSETWQAIGVRMGVDKIWKSTVSGPVSGSPFTHINGYARLSIEGSSARFDVYAGGTFQFLRYPDTEMKEQVYLKGGADIKYKLTPNFGLIASGSLCKYSSYLGIGVYLSYQ